MWLTAPQWYCAPRSNKWFDVIEDIAYACIFVWVFHSIVDETGAPRPASARQQLVFGLAALWIARLLAFLAFRIVVRGSDFRFDKLATEPCYCLFGWTSGENAMLCCRSVRSL